MREKKKNLESGNKLMLKEGNMPKHLLEPLLPLSVCDIHIFLEVFFWTKFLFFILFYVTTVIRVFDFSV